MSGRRFKHVWRGGRCLVGILLLASLACGPACAIAVSKGPESTPVGHESVTTVSLHGKPIDLHMASPATLTRADFLVLYASGDGGWFGTATEMWRQIARAGFATAGFSSRAFLRIERPAGSALNPAQLAREYDLLADEAQHALGLPANTHVILVGWSRGAAFSVLVGTDRKFRDRLSGVVAIGLADGEDLTIDGDGDDTDDGSVTVGAHVLPFDTYALLSQLESPCAVIQATRDSYFPAAEARRRFGPDTPVHRFYEVEAKNHRFSGGKAAFDAALVDALKWMSAPNTPAASQGGGGR